MTATFPQEQLGPWTRDLIKQHLEVNPYRIQALNNSLGHTASLLAAANALADAPRQVWFSQGFSPEQTEARKQIIAAAEAICRNQVYAGIASFLNKLEVPGPNAASS